MAWEIEYTDEFEAWWNSLDGDEQESLAASIGLVEQLGPQLPRPHSDTVNGSKHSNMKELRTQHRGRPIRTFYRSTRAGWRSCSLAGTRPATRDSMIG